MILLTYGGLLPRLANAPLFLAPTYLHAVGNKYPEVGALRQSKHRSPDPTFSVLVPVSLFFLCYLAVPVRFPGLSHAGQGSGEQ